MVPFPSSFNRDDDPAIAKWRIRIGFVVLVLTALYLAALPQSDGVEVTRERNRHGKPPSFATLSRCSVASGKPLEGCVANFEVELD